MGKRIMKKFCVLQVTPTEPTAEHVEYFSEQEECDFYFVTHDAPNEKALKYCPNTTWTDTRNTLVEMVPKKYEYYAFVDYDYVLRPLRNLSVKEQILEDLNEFKPAILTYYPGKGMITPFADSIEYRDSKDASVIPFAHAGFKVVHHSLLDWFFPMITNFGGGVEACHLFNILEIPFLRHVVCSHKMVYDNGNSDMEAPHNIDGRWNDHCMDEMWKWIRPAFKKTSTIDSYARRESDKLHSLLIKYVFQNLALENKILPVKKHNIEDYFNLDTIELFFDLQHDFFINKKKPHSEQIVELDETLISEVESVLKNEVTFELLKSKNNPWVPITKKVNSCLESRRNITTNECLEIYQNMDNSNSVFYKNSNIHKNLAEFLKDKTVALVGPAPYLKGLGKGELIDSHDVVVRIQHGIDSTIDYGSRSDIIQSCLNANYGPPLVKYLKELSNDRRPKYIICNDTVSELNPHGEWIETSQIYEPIFEEIGIPLVHLKNNDDTWDRWALYWEIYPKQHVERFDNRNFTIQTANFNSGYGAINFLLRYPISKLSVYGMDFYNTGVPQTHDEKYTQEYIDTYGNNGGHLKGPDEILHDQLGQIKHCRNILLKDSRLIFEEEVKEKILSEQVSSRLEKFKMLPKIIQDTR
jgi:hypothetical protein